MRRPPFLVVLGVLCFGLPLRSGLAQGTDDKVRCAASYEAVQERRRAGTLATAKEQARICVATCPTTLRKDCERWDEELTALLPTVRLRATTKDGASIAGVRVLLDGFSFASAADDVPRVADTGEHVFRFEKPGYLPAEQRITLHPSERGRVVEVTLELENRSAPAASRPSHLLPAGTASPPAPADSRSTLPSILLWSGAGAALAVSGGLALKGHGDRDELASTCAPVCPPSELDAVRTIWITSAVIGAVGALLATAGFVVFPWSRGDADQKKTGALPLKLELEL